MHEAAPFMLTLVIPRLILLFITLRQIIVFDTPRYNNSIIYGFDHHLKV